MFNFFGKLVYCVRVVFARVLYVIFRKDVEGRRGGVSVGG